MRTCAPSGCAVDAAAAGAPSDVRLGGLGTCGGCAAPEPLPSRGAALSVRLRRTVPGRLRPFRKLHGGQRVTSSHMRRALILRQ